MLASLHTYWSLLGARGVLGAIAGKALGRQVRIPLALKELAHPVQLRVPSSDAGAYRQIFLESQYEIAVTRPPAVIVDAGANIGLASVFFANRFPSATVFAIECERSNFELLRANVAPYKQVVPIHAALWNVEGNVQVVDPGLGKWGFMTKAGAPQPGAESVRARTLEGIMKEHRIAHVDILKIDIEGAELEVLNASAPWIHRVDAIIAELHDRLKAGCEESFSQATRHFQNRWQQGENVCVTRDHSCVVPRWPASRAAPALL